VHFCSDTDTPRSLKSTFPTGAPLATNPGTKSDTIHAQYHSRIWSGNYADGGNNYTYVHLQWRESCTAFGTNDVYSTWAGLGGVGNNNLVQAGADGVNSGAFSHYYEAWVENTADEAHSGYVFGINCGDRMVEETAAGNCSIVLDLTSGASSGWRCFGPNANSGTAECIIEAPTNTSNNTIYPLSNYGTETLQYCDVEINAGSDIGIGNVAHDYFNMYNGSTLLSSTGSISGGDTYTMTWHAFN
jgi:hypothetical protein